MFGQNYIINATQGVLSTIPNYPVFVDTYTYAIPDNPNDNPDTALIVGAMRAVPMSYADGVLVERKSYDCNRYGRTIF